MLTYVFIWLIVKGFFDTHGNGIPAETIPYAGWAAGLAVGSVVLYYLALMCSHLAAFRVESNLRKEAMRQIVRMPLGFFDLNTNGKIRKVIDDNAGITHSFLAHQMPDLTGSVLVPLTAVILIFTFDWKLGLVCIIPVAVAMFLMGHLMNTQGQASCVLHDFTGRNEYGSRRICQGHTGHQGIPTDHLLFQELP